MIAMGDPARLRVPRMDESDDGLPRRLFERRGVVVAGALAAFAAITAWRLISTDTDDTIGLLYTVPIALGALELGIYAGIGLAAAALALIGVAAAVHAVEIGPLGFLTRGVAFVAVGLIAGRFAERMRAVHRLQQGLLESAMALKWVDPDRPPLAELARAACRLSGARGARVELLGRVESSGIAAGRSISAPIVLRGERVGLISAHFARAPGPEAALALELLALQAANGLEGARMAAQEAERMHLSSELHEARSRLASSAERVHELVASREAERAQIATALREDISQMLAAVLLGIASFEQELAGDHRAADHGSENLARVREHIGETIHALRALATSLRPASLALGLRPALEQLGTAPGHLLAVSVGELGELGSETETTIFRVAQEALEAAAGARTLTVGLTPDRSAVEMRIEGAPAPPDAQRLAVLSGNIELLGGRLDGDGADLRLQLPLAWWALSAPAQR